MLTLLGLGVWIFILAWLSRRQTRAILAMQQRTLERQAEILAQMRRREGGK